MSESMVNPVVSVSPRSDESFPAAAEDSYCLSDVETVGFTAIDERRVKRVLLIPINSSFIYRSKRPGRFSVSASLSVGTYAKAHSFAPPSTQPLHTLHNLRAHNPVKPVKK